MKHRVVRDFRSSEVAAWQQERLEILDLVANRWPITPTGAANALDRPLGTMKRLMWLMAQDGQLAGGGRDGYVPVEAVPR